jgi:hypothetical protein
MPTKVSEKKLLGAIACITAGIFLFFKIAYPDSPVRVSETNLVYTAIATCFIVYGVILLNKAFVKSTTN